MQALHHALPAFAPLVPTGLLPYITALFLLPTFALAFYFSTYVSRSNTMLPLTPALQSSKR